MIKLNKLVLPDSIINKIEERAASFSKCIADGVDVPDALASSYKAKDIKEFLRRETSDKCAYCESKVPHIDHGDVEHILPKSIFPDLRFSYENLTYACGICNTKKGSFYDAGVPLLNPYKDLPEDHLMPVGPMVLRVPTSDRGLLTEKKLDLNRSDLVERRQERLQAAASLVDQIVRTKNQTIRAVLREEIAKECLADKEYSLVVRGYIASVKSTLDQ